MFFRQRAPNHLSTWKGGDPARYRVATRLRSGAYYVNDPQCGPSRRLSQGYFECGFLQGPNTCRPTEEHHANGNHSSSNRDGVTSMGLPSDRALQTSRGPSSALPCARTFSRWPLKHRKDCSEGAKHATNRKQQLGAWCATAHTGRLL